jgi:hypothetical protein
MSMILIVLFLVSRLGLTICSQENDAQKAAKEQHYGNLSELMVQGSSVIAAGAVLSVMVASVPSEKLRLIQRYSLFSMLNHGYSIGSKAPYFNPLSAEVIALAVHIIAYAVSRYKFKDTMEGDVAWLLQVLKGGGVAGKPVATKDKTK